MTGQVEHERETEHYTVPVERLWAALHELGRAREMVSYLLTDGTDPATRQRITDWVETPTPRWID